MTVPESEGEESEAKGLHSTMLDLEMGSRPVSASGIRPAILGFTGFIPGLNFRHGETYGKAANNCLKELFNRAQQRLRAQDKSKRSASAPPPPLRALRAQEDIRRCLDHFFTARANKALGPNLRDPISGYTGHVPFQRSFTGKNYLAATREGREKHEMLRLRQEKELQSTTSSPSPLPNVHPRIPDQFYGDGFMASPTSPVTDASVGWRD
ncbi:unnamed protein product [Darwinula stevensoni]|uniref:Ciliary microtubule inner protein 2A-C-like domain-containing protein n=1 Tax=Darwinula stevensoni TaxID=69355 RepID=A0A7R9AC26_9CRUS|nr:unnamed protein product [Darwinula stevensoni]CAG0899599.1 unnamed protein product [Darwinula stevensoni]